MRDHKIYTCILSYVKTEFGEFDWEALFDKSCKKHEIATCQQAMRCDSAAQAAASDWVHLVLATQNAPYSWEKHWSVAIEVDVYDQDECKHFGTYSCSFTGSIDSHRRPYKV